MKSKELKKELVDLFVDARVKYFGMAIACGGKLPSFYKLKWKDFGLSERARKLGLAPEDSIESTLRDIKKKMREGGIR